MVNVILKFVSCCRAADMRVSTAEVLDCLQQLECVDICDERQFNTVLRANFAKSRREQAEFDRLYHLFFHEMQSGISSSLLPEDAEGPEGDLDGISEKMDQLVREIRAIQDPEEIDSKTPKANELDQALLDFLAGNPLAFIQIGRASCRERV